MVSQSAEALHSVSQVGNSGETKMEGLYQGRSIYKEHMLSVRRNVLAPILQYVLPHFLQYSVIQHACRLCMHCCMQNSGNCALVI